jgi:hypothetical protein
MRRNRMRLASAALAIIGALAVAQIVNAAPQPLQLPIVVQGRLKQAIRNFVQRLSQVGPSDQIAHWKDQICPTVLGMDPAQAAFLEQRINALARTVRLRPGGSNCLSALAIVVTNDPNAFVADMLGIYPMSLRADGLDRLKRFVQSSRPVRWISITNECGYGCAIGSRISRETAPALAGMLIVVDSNRLQDVTVQELSDYIALVALTNPPDRPGSHPNSVLELFDDPGPAGSSFALTDYDRSFLAALYHEPVDRSADDERATIGDAMEHSLKAKPPPKRN